MIGIFITSYIHPTDIPTTVYGTKHDAYTQPSRVHPVAATRSCARVCLTSIVSPLVARQGCLDAAAPQDRVDWLATNIPWDPVRSRISSPTPAVAVAVAAVAGCPTEEATTSQTQTSYLGLSTRDAEQTVPGTASVPNRGSLSRACGRTQIIWMAMGGIHSFPDRPLEGGPRN